MNKEELKRISEDAKNQIIGKLKTASQKRINGHIPNKVDMSVPVFPVPQNLLDTFSKELTAVNGQVHLYSGNKELIQQFTKVVAQNNWKNLFCRDPEITDKLQESNFSFLNTKDELLNAEVGITRCEFLVARSGSVMVSSAHPSGRLVNIFPPIHCIIAQRSQIIPYLEDALTGIQKRYAAKFPSHIAVITGPSRTADIEKTLVMGAHGPKELHVFIDLEG